MNKKKINKKNVGDKNVKSKGHHPLIRTIYLYLFALIGLALLITGTVRLVNMGLKALIFTKADNYLRMEAPPIAPVGMERIEELQDGVQLSEEQLSMIDNWLEDYQAWQKNVSGNEGLISSRQREASTSISLILVGLPLYLFHWSIIRRETKAAKSA
ncbi:MAG: hypothetical protein COT37_01625 [Parcubacteria group bacterium CG08_land_8_20_14_0_20_43_9]|nr:MAG: hypothetical protein COT37_01625 [Parcubacteria group bacterium CG08_land_8_20_14_0_20_43_9]